MTPQELKNSILQYAIQGKLVEQRAEEGTGEELFKEIQAEKKKLIKEGKIKKEKPLPEITEDEIPFDIPESWKGVRLEDVVSVNTGLTFKKQDQKSSTTGDLRILRGGNIGDDFRYHLFDNDVFVKKEQFQNKYIPLQKGDVIIPSVTSIEKICKTGYIDSNMNNVTAGGFVYIIRCLDINCLSPKFLLYFISSAFNKEQCKPNIHKSGQAFYNLKKSGFIEQPIPLPPLAEQKRIVAKIEELLPYIDRYEKAWSKLEDFNTRFPEDMQKSLLQYAIQGKLVEQRAEEGTGEELFKEIQAEKKKLIKEGKIKKEKPQPEITEDEIPFDIPESWKWVRLGECSSYAQAKKKLSPANITSNLWSLDLEDIEKETGKIINYCKAGDKKISGDKVFFEKGQLLYSKLRPYLKKILVATADGVCSPELVPFEMYGDTDHKYILYVLKSPHINFSINSATYGVKMPRVGTYTMTSLLIPLPPLAEQKRIVAKLEELLPLCEKLK